MDVEKTDEILKMNVSNNKEDNEIDTFAKGLPAWDLLPPQMIIKRRRSE